MFVELTLLDGLKVFLRVEDVDYFQDRPDGAGSIVQTVYGNWLVQETPDEIMDAIDKA